MSPKIDRRTTKHGARFRITVPEDRQRNIIQRLERQSKQTHWRIRQNYRHRRPDQPRPTAPPPPLSRQILAVNVANISNKRPAIRHIVRNTRLWAISETCITSSKFRFTVPGFDVIQHPATGPGRRGIVPRSPGSAQSMVDVIRQSTTLCVMHQPAHSLPRHVWTDRQQWPTTLSFAHPFRAEAQGQPPAPRAPTISRHHCLEATDRIATSNYWDVLADGASDDTDTDTDVHQLTSQFLESANAVADQLSLRLSPPATRSNRRLLSGTTKRAILASNTARQAFIAAATNRNPDPVQCNTLRDEWSRLKAAATQLERVDGRKQWVKHADNLDRAVSDGRTDLVFAAARAMSGNSSRSAAVTPLYNSDGIVQYDPTSILRVMQGHYGSLGSRHHRNSDILDQDFSWNQIAAALLQMSPRKAPGDDGITTAFYQAALYMPANTQEGVPPTPICSCSVENGDPLNPGDKRGIALINVGLKLVCKVLQMRIERFVETNNLLSYEQAGFRKREECVGQVVSLVDIIQRRQNAGLNTHVLFIDIRKAFDTVPVGALLWKLQNMGFPRRTLAFLKALYTSSSARARAGSLLSGPHSQYREVSDRDVHCLDYYSICSSTTFSMVSHPSQSLDYRETQPPSEDSYHSAWLKQKRSALEHTISALHPVLANHQLTVNYRSRIFSAVVMGKAYYGLELVGGNKSHLAPLQTTINKGIRLFTGARLSTAIGPLLVETGIGSLLTRSLVSRVRLLERSVTKRTPINAICSGTDNDVFTLNVQGQLVRSQRWFWSRRTKQLYRNRYWLTPQVRPKTVKQRHSFALMETLRTCGDSASLQKYVTRQLLDTSWVLQGSQF
ncbi:hypothetical protein BASA81_010903 [Batrachochytrium salamandrivorans]|nr:hypothetical protein BASA81_010903 [Batrachochytrium salamandrivorans]